MNCSLGPGGKHARLRSAGAYEARRAPKNRRVASAKSRSHSGPRLSCSRSTHDCLAVIDTSCSYCGDTAAVCSAAHWWSTGWHPGEPVRGSGFRKGQRRSSSRLSILLCVDTATHGNTKAREKHDGSLTVQFVICMWSALSKRFGECGQQCHGHSAGSVSGMASDITKSLSSSHSRSLRLGSHTSTLVTFVLTPRIAHHCALPCRFRANVLV